MALRRFKCKQLNNFVTLKKTKKKFILNVEMTRSIHINIFKGSFFHIKRICLNSNTTVTKQLLH